jgi:RHS repeat-associated protein
VGEDRYTSGTVPSGYRFTGQKYESTPGLYYYGARWYDSSLGRFLSADTIVPNMGDPQAWDRYAAMNNNPVRFIDPSGHIACYDARDEKCGQSHEYRNILRQLPKAAIVRKDKDAQWSYDRVIKNYYDIRMELYQETGDAYISPDGKIKDPAVMAMIIAGEFQYQGKGEDHDHAFEEAKEVRWSRLFRQKNSRV